MKKQINFISAITREAPSLVKKLERLLDKSFDFGSIDDGDLVGIKLHFGEVENTAYVHPVFIRTIVDKVKSAGGRPFLTDTTTLYRHERFNGVTATELAYRHGFSYGTIGAPLIIGDGIRGLDYFEIATEEFRHFKSVKLASVLRQMDAMIVVSHFKGHMVSGFGGAIKNLAMGLGSKGQKQRMHADFHPNLKSVDACTACGECMEVCPADCITIEDEHAIFNFDDCIGCGECVAYCPFGAVKIKWKTNKTVFNQKLVETAAGVVKAFKGPKLYLNFLLNITPDCDCLDRNDIPIVPDIGILAGDDPVAIDAASMELVNKAPVMPGSILAESESVSDDKIASYRPDVDWATQLSYGVALGLGSDKFEINEV